MNKLSEAIATLQFDVIMNENVAAKPLLSDLFGMYKAVGEKPMSFVYNQLTNEEYSILVQVKNKLAA